MIKWTDKKSTLSVGKRIFKAGDVIPAGILSDDRITYLQKTGQIQVIEKGDKIVVDKVVAKVFDKEITKPVETIFEDEEKSKKVKQGKQEQIPFDDVYIEPQKEKINKAPIEPDLMSGLMGGKGAKS